MLVRMAEAIGRLTLAGRELTRLSGFTARVHELIVVLRELHKGVYSRTMVSSSNEKTKDGTLYIVCYLLLLSYSKITLCRHVA